MTIDDRIKAARDTLTVLQNELTDKLSTEKTRARAPLTRQLHTVRGMLSATFPYASQAGQDLIVDRIMNQKTNGTFVDIGAYDGITGSNTMFFERWRNWTGILVEPVAAQRIKAEKLRSSPCMAYAVSNKTGTADFITITEGFTQMSGLLNTYDDHVLKRVRSDPRHMENIGQVSTHLLSDILLEAGIMHPDFVSLDIEGGELAALQVFAFDKHDVTVWSIGNNNADPALPALMREKGYNLADFCGPDEIYVKIKK